MPNTDPEEWERLVSAHIELGSTREEAIALAQAQQKKSNVLKAQPAAVPYATLRRQQKVRKSVRLLALGVLPAVLLSNIFIYRFDYGWNWLLVLSAVLPTLLGLRLGVMLGIGSAKAWVKESLKVTPHLAIVYLLWSLTQPFEAKLPIGLFLTVFHMSMALFVGALGSVIGGVIKGGVKTEKSSL